MHGFRPFHLSSRLRELPSRSVQLYLSELPLRSPPLQAHASSVPGATLETSDHTAHRQRKGGKSPRPKETRLVASEPRQGFPPLGCHTSQSIFTRTSPVLRTRTHIPRRPTLPSSYTPSMDSSPSTSLEGSWRSESYMPFASSSSSAHPYAFASSSKARSHTYPSGSGSYDYQHDHGSHEGSGNGYSNGSSGMGPGAEGGIVNQGDGADHADAPDGASGAGGSGALRDEASSAWSSSLPTPTSARSEPYKAGSSSTWPRYRDTLSGDSHWRTHQHHPSASSSSHPARDMATNGRADDTNTHIINGHAFPGTGYPLVPPIPPSTFISGHPPTESHGIGKGTAVGKGKGKGKAVEREHEDTGMSLAGRIEVWAKVMDTSKGRDKVLVSTRSLVYRCRGDGRGWQCSYHTSRSILTVKQKCGQYSMRTYLYLLTLILRVRPLPPWFTSNRKRVQLAVSGLSLTRCVHVDGFLGCWPLACLGWQAGCWYGMGTLGRASLEAGGSDVEAWRDLSSFAAGGETMNMARDGSSKCRDPGSTGLYMPLDSAPITPSIKPKHPDPILIIQKMPAPPQPPAPHLRSPIAPTDDRVRNHHAPCRSRLSHVG